MVNYLHQPVIGIHGSHILTSGRAENAAGWETACVAEDYWFSVQAHNKGIRFGWLPTVAREQSPGSIHDFMRQRRRWYTGIWACGHLPGRVSLLWWGWGVFEPVL
jgi:egghead protein (zeste-white 4 protein)